MASTRALVSRAIISSSLVQTTSTFTRLPLPLMSRISEGALLILCGSTGDAQEPHILTHAGAHAVVVLADAAGEHQAVQPPHSGGVGTYIFLDLIRKHLGSQFGALVAPASAPRHTPHIAGNAGMPSRRFLFR